MNDYFVAITGASGSIYGLRIIKELSLHGQVSVVITKPGRIVLEQEMSFSVPKDSQGIESLLKEKLEIEKLNVYDIEDIGAPSASGSVKIKAMVVAPCSMATLAKISHGISGNLLERTADVFIKEGRPLLLLPRETPLSTIHLRNMLSLSKVGVKIIPAMPAFYHNPNSLEDMINFVVGKVLEQLNISHALYNSWDTISQ